MKTHRFSAILFTLLSSMSVACVSPTGGDDPVETPDLEQQKDTAAAQGGDRLIVSVETPTGSTMRFLQIGEDGELGVLVVESGAPETMVMDRLLDDDGEGLGPYGLFVALTAPGTEIPAELTVGKLEAESSARQGWALETIPQLSPIINNFACDNAAFTSSTPGGLLGNEWTLLDTNYEQHPGVWTPDSVCNGGICTAGRKQYGARWNNLTQWRGKVCGHPRDRIGQATHTICYYPGPTCLLELPYVWFQYNTPGSGTVNYAGGDDFPMNTNTTRSWAWYGNPGVVLDWRINVYEAMPWDEFDILMSRP